MVSTEYKSQYGCEGDGTNTSNVNYDVHWAAESVQQSKVAVYRQHRPGSYQLQTNDTKTNWMTYMILEDNLTKVVGKHELEFGIHFRRNILNSLAKQRYPQSQLDYGTMATALMDPNCRSAVLQAVPQTGSISPTCFSA
jgi:hypothetical protein